MMKTYQEVLDYLYVQFPEYQKVGDKAMKPGLGNMLKLEDHLGHPSRAFKVIHVAGTNGKGSVSHSLASILQSAGYIVGLYTSPHLHDFRERIRVDGAMIPEEYVMRFVNEHEIFLKDLHASFFEISTAMAFDYFKFVGVEVAIVEVGLGGRLDSTNVVWPELCVITNIGLDHTQFLGNSLPEIAKEKAGIIKEEIPVVIGERHPETDEVFIDMAGIQEAPIYFAEDEYKIIECKTEGGISEYVVLDRQKNHQHKIPFSLTGNYQRKNLLTILKAASLLQTLGYDMVDIVSIREGLKAVQEQTGLMGRWQKIASKPDMIVDTGHNAHGMKYVAEQLNDEMQHYSDLHIVIGMVDDKHPEEVLPLLPKEAKYYFTQASTHRAVPSEELRKMGEKAGRLGKAYNNVQEAIDDAKKNASANSLIFIGGSNYTVAEV
ncbi:MAG: folylpolyglutamate synthase/dihydrofolate synthase family protein [Bacteroidia bacterium]|nr:folylpolyglutamate synthase/dihydrofolate synthase family protein [Bacteroidia bacterium]